MKAIVPIFALLAAMAAAAWAQVPTLSGDRSGRVVPASATAPADSNSGNALVRRIVARVDELPAVAAKLRQKVDLLDRGLIGSGIYLQQGRGPQRQWRLEMKLQQADAVSRIEQVCDGNQLWILEDLGGAASLARVDMTRLRQARPKAGGTPPSPAAWVGLGGLPKLLVNLESSFRFDMVGESRLDTLRVWTLEGQWEPRKLAALLPDQKGAIDSGKQADLSRLAPNLPDRVVLHVGCDDFFPYRIEYWRSLDAGKGRRSDDDDKLLLVMELFEVQLGGRIDPRQFVFQPGKHTPADQTQIYLDKLALEESAPAGAKSKSPPRR